MKYFFAFAAVLLMLVSSDRLSVVRAHEEDAESPEAAATEEKTEEKEEAAKEEKKEEAKEKPERKTFEVEPAAIKLKETLDGAFAAEKMAEVSLEPETWTAFKIKKVVEHGAKVQEGEVLLEFESEDLLDAIADLELDLHLSEQRIARAERELPQKEESITRQLADAEESLRRVEEDYQRYKDVEREQTIESVNRSLKSSKFNLDYYQDELDELEKMYEADDLTEETEEIVLRRQRYYVDMYKYYYERAQYNHDITMRIRLPRLDHDLEESLNSSRQRLEQAQTANQVDLTVARYELEKLRRQRKKSIERHVDLLADKSLLEVRAPASGVVYYGEAADGKWNKVDEFRKKLVVGKNADRGVVLLTIVQPGSLSFVCKLDQKWLTRVKKGQSVEVEPAVDGADPLEGSIASISSAPLTGGKFEVKVELTDELPDWLLPGLSGKATVVVYDKKDALLVPAEAVHTDDMTEEKYVWQVKGDDVEKVIVETGKSKAKQVEITDGLSAGDTISLEDEDKAKEKE